MALNKETVRTWLGNVPGEHVFWCCDGRTLRNLGDLADALNDMSEESYRHHVMGGHNDFSSWVRDVVGDAALSNRLEKAPSRASAAKAVSARLKWLAERR